MTQHEKYWYSGSAYAVLSASFSQWLWFLSAGIKDLVKTVCPRITWTDEQGWLRGLSFSLCDVTGQWSAAATPPPAGGSNKRSQPSLSLFDFSYRFFSHTGLICSPCANRDIAFWTAQYQMQSECWAVVCQHCPLLISHCFFFLSTKGTRKGCVNAEFAYLWLQTAREPKTCLSLSLPCFSLFVSLLLTESHLHSSCKPGDCSTHFQSKVKSTMGWNSILLTW